MKTETKNPVELIAHTELTSDQHMFPTDMMPILAARVSHGDDGKTGKDMEADMRLMKYLAKHKHFSVFEHVSVTFKITAPIFVAREWMRHRTQSYNEISMRYSSDPVGKFWVPETFRKQEVRNKQGSAEDLPDDIANQAFDLMVDAYEVALESYNKMIELGVAREIARAVVPVGNYTEFYATANLRNWNAFCSLRLDETAQKEIRDYAKEIDRILGGVYPNSWRTLREFA